MGRILRRLWGRSLGSTEVLVWFCELQLAVTTNRISLKRMWNLEQGCYSFGAQEQSWLNNVCTFQPSIDIGRGGLSSQNINASELVKPYHVTSLCMVSRAHFLWHLLTSLYSLSVSGFGDKFHELFRKKDRKSGSSK